MTYLRASLALACAIWLSSRAFAQPPAKDAAKGDGTLLMVVGQILKEDAPDPARGVPAKVHAVKMLKGQAYVIDLVSSDFDAFLRLVDSAGNQLAQDDDGGGNLNSRIRYSADKDDTYLLYASPLGGGEGAYTLTVKSFVLAPAKVVPLQAPAANKPSEVQSVLNANDPPNQFRNHPGKIHSIDLKAGKTYVIDLMSQQFDCYLILQDAKGAALAQDDDGGGNLNSRIRFQPPADGTFRIIATTFNGQVGPFTLRVTEQP